MPASSTPWFTDYDTVTLAALPAEFGEFTSADKWVVARDGHGF